MASIWRFDKSVVRRGYERCRSASSRYSAFRRGGHVDRFRRRSRRRQDYGGPGGGALSDGGNLQSPYLEARDLYPGRSTEQDNLSPTLPGAWIAGSDAAEPSSWRCFNGRRFPVGGRAETLAVRFRLVAMTNADRIAFSCYSTLDPPFHDSVTIDETGGVPKPSQFFALSRPPAFGFSSRRKSHRPSQHHDIGIAKELDFVCLTGSSRKEPRTDSRTPSTEAGDQNYFGTLAELADAVEDEAANVAEPEGCLSGKQ